MRDPVIKISATHDERNHTVAGMCSSGFFAKSFKMPSWHAVHRPPPIVNKFGAVDRTDLQGLPNEAKAKMQINIASQFELVRSLILRAENSWIGVDTATCDPLDNYVQIIHWRTIMRGSGMTPMRTLWGSKWKQSRSYPWWILPYAYPEDHIFEWNARLGRLTRWKKFRCLRKPWNVESS